MTHNFVLCFSSFLLNGVDTVDFYLSYKIVLSYCSLVRPANLDQLVNYVLQKPAEDDNEKTKYKLVCVCYCLTRCMFVYFFKQSNYHCRCK